MEGLNITSFVTVIANSIACNATDNELALYAAIFAQLGDTLATIATTRALCENNNSDENQK